MAEEISLSLGQGFRGGVVQKTVLFIMGKYRRSVVSSLCLMSAFIDKLWYSLLILWTNYRPQ